MLEFVSISYHPRLPLDDAKGRHGEAEARQRRGLRQLGSGQADGEGVVHPQRHGLVDFFHGDPREGEFSWTPKTTRGGGGKQEEEIGKKIGTKGRNQNLEVIYECTEIVAAFSKHACPCNSTCNTSETRLMSITKGFHQTLHVSPFCCHQKSLDSQRCTSHSQS